MRSALGSSNVSGRTRWAINKRLAERANYAKVKRQLLILETSARECGRARESAHLLARVLAGGARVMWAVWARVWNFAQCSGLRPGEFGVGSGADSVELGDDVGLEREAHLDEQRPLAQVLEVLVRLTRK